MSAERAERIRLQGMEHYGFGPEAMKKLKVCTVCGASAPKDRQFCTECGHRLPDKTLYDIYKERHKTCPVCDTVLSDGMEYCPQCGASAEAKTKDILINDRKDENK